MEPVYFYAPKATKAYVFLVQSTKPEFLQEILRLPNVPHSVRFPDGRVVTFDEFHKMVLTPGYNAVIIEYVE